MTVWAQRLGARQVVVSDPVEARREGAASFGATGSHDPDQDPPPRDFDAVFECVGAPGLVQTAIDAAVTRGRVVVAGVCVSADSILPVTALVKEVEVRFAMYYRGDEFAAAARLLESGGINVNAFVSGQVALDGITDAFSQLLTRGGRKLLVVP